MTAYNLDEKTGLMGMFAVKSPSKIIRKNDSIDFKHFNLFDFVKATILDVNDSSIKIHSNDKTPDINAFPGDHVILNYGQGDEMYVLSGEITVIDNMDPLEFLVSIKKIDKIKDLRKCERLSVSLKADLKLIGIPETKFAIVKNISLGGVKLNCKEDIMMEDMVEVTVRLDKLVKTNFKARVVRKNQINDFLEYGLEISEITETNSKALYRYVFTI